MNTQLQQWTFHAFTDIVVIGTNPEMADIDNPHGHLYGYASYIRAYNDHGESRLLFVKTDRCHETAVRPAIAQANALNARLDSGRLPVKFETWQKGRAVYGSRAWTEYGNDEQLAFERECE